MTTPNQYVADGSYAATSRNVRITIAADCLKANGRDLNPSKVTYTAPDAATIADITNDDGELVLVRCDHPTSNAHNRLGRFVPAGSFQASSKNIVVTVEAECLKVDQTYHLSHVWFHAEAAKNIADIANVDGDVQLKVRRSGNALDDAKVTWTAAADYDALAMDDSALIGVTADGATTPIGPGSSYSVGSVKGGVVVTKTLLGPKFTVVASAAVIRIASKGAIGDIDGVDVSVLEAHADADMDLLYAGAGVGFRLAGGSASIFDFDLGVGLSTGAGIKDNSIEVKLAGTGVTVGQKISISVFDNSFGLDLVRTAHAVGYVGKELAVAVAIVPGAFASAGTSLAGEFKAMPGTFAQAGVGIGSEAAKIPGAVASAPAQMWSGVVDSVKGLADLF